MSTTHYQPIAGEYSYAKLRVGTVLRNAMQQEVYFQPGDDEATLLDSIDALDEIADDGRRAVVADIAFGGYFDG